MNRLTFEKMITQLAILNLDRFYAPFVTDRTKDISSDKIVERIQASSIFTQDLYADIVKFQPKVFPNGIIEKNMFFVFNYVSWTSLRLEVLFYQTRAQFLQVYLTMAPIVIVRLFTVTKNSTCIEQWNAV